MKSEQIKWVYTKLTPLTMVWLPKGDFFMGSDDVASCEDERPVRRVFLNSGFWLGKYPVTQEQWEHITGRESRSGFFGLDRPVETVCYRDCMEFFDRLYMLTGIRFRLPTEAEWEYACRAGSIKPCYPCKSYQDLDEYAWYSENSGFRSKPVGKKKPNAWGLYDMLGNVWELCEDWYDPGYYALGASEDPKGPFCGREKAARGGAWSSICLECRPSARYSIGVNEVSNIFGFRIAADTLEPEFDPEDMYKYEPSIDDFDEFDVDYYDY